MNNRKRSKRGADVIGAYIIRHGLEQSGTDQENLTDILADLMHFAHSQRDAEDCPMDFDNALDDARMHFNAEQKGKFYV